MDVLKPNKYKILFSFLCGVVVFFCINYVAYLKFNQCIWITNQDPNAFRGTPTELCGLLPFYSNPFPYITVYGDIEILWGLFTFGCIYVVYSWVEKRKQGLKKKALRKNQSSSTKH